MLGDEIKKKAQYSLINFSKKLTMKKSNSPGTPG